MVTAPFAGIVTDVPAIAPGKYLAASTTAFYLVDNDHVWVDANPKETELTYVRPGQQVTVTVDTYPDQVWHGTVESISPAAAQEFSLLPAQNTSGNWVKVVQRVPMRVRVDTGDKTLPPLRAGMSVEVDVDTGHARGFPALSDVVVLVDAPWPPRKQKLAATAERSRSASILATLMQALDTTIANVALPYMQGSMSASHEQIDWVLTSYIVAAAIMTPPTGFLAGKFGIKRLFLVSIGGFTCRLDAVRHGAIADQIVLFRVLQGAFGAALVPLSQSLLFGSIRASARVSPWRCSGSA